MADGADAIFKADCPSRAVIDQVADKWSMLILASLCDGPLRFNALRRRISGITQKALTQALRRLERSGIVSRRVSPGPPVAVDYTITKLGRSLEDPFAALYAWTLKHHREVEAAQRRFDASSDR